MARAAGQRLRPFQADAARGIGVEIKAANVGQDLLVAVAASEFAEAAGPVIDAELELVIRARLDES